MAVGSSIIFKLVAVMVVYMVVAAPYVAGDRLCNQAETELIPCLPYLSDRAKTPDDKCCAGVKTLNKDATTTGSRKEVCGCLKGLLVKYPVVKDKNAGDLASKCKVDLPYKVSRNTDCSNLQRACSECGLRNEAISVFDSMAERDLVSWNSLLSGRASHGCGQEVIELFEQMKSTGIQPNGTTILSVLSACSHVGLLEKGLE
ncbi:Non-specific lipid-transfer protein-like protein [Drosera capensis]